jgi:pimeloyl-ACP methyl ester carboxylesterase
MPPTAMIALAAGAAGAWVAAARDAGLFHHGHHTAAAPGEPTLDAWSQRKRYLDVGTRTVAYVEEGSGDPVLLLHGCPFHALEWQQVIPQLAGHYRVLAPDLPGLGDTPVRLDDDYRLPQIAQTIVDLLDTLGIDAAHVVGHDHGGATAMLLMDHHPDRFRSLVLTNAEAYDQWPSQPERKYLRLVVNPLTSPLFKQALRMPALRREVLSIAVHDPATLTGELAAALFRAHTATPARWQRLRRFLRWQLDPDHNRLTTQAIPAMRRFEPPTLLLWGRHDTNFGPELAERLAADIPGSVGAQYLEHSAHLPMLEEPAAYADALLAFLKSVEPSTTSRSRATSATPHDAGT